METTRTAAGQPRPIRRILLAMGLTTESVGAVLMARSLASRFGAELHAVHVIEPISDEAEAAIPGLAAKHLAQAEEEMGHFAATHGLDDGVSRHVVRGSPETEVLALRKRLDADLLVFGRYGRGGLKRDRLGSVADRLVRHCPVPAMVVAPEFRGEYAHIGVASDTDRDNPVEIRRALDLAATLGADRITLISAWELPHGYHTVLTREEASAKLEAIARERSEAAIARVRSEDDPEVRIVTKLGRPHEAVSEAVQEQGLDLLVLSTHYRTGKAASMLLGRTTERILSRVNCSVWAETTPELHQGFLDALRHLFD